MITRDQIQAQLGNCLQEARFEQWASYYGQGKVRDIYFLPGRRILITTDRQSAFDHVLGAIPFKGQVLNRMTQYWFEQTQNIATNQVLSVPHGNVTVARELRMFPVEIVVRRYLTGSSDTAIWTHYDRGERLYCGYQLPDGLRKNTRLPRAIITPTTKSEGHDELLSCAEVVDQGLVAPEIWRQVEQIALALFERGTILAAQRGLILVDTKIEMGLDDEGHITVADELFTPDSARYWIMATYPKRHNRGEEPESLDKEFLRLWLRDKGISDTNIPALDDEIRIQVAERYIDLYERVTGQTFVPDVGAEPVRDQIERVVAAEFAADQEVAEDVQATV